MTAVRWPWRRRRLPEPPEIPLHLKEAERAVVDAVEELAETRGRDARVRKTAQALRKIRAENDFANAIRNALRP